MPTPISTTLPIDLTLHLTGTLTHTTSALTDPPRPEVDTLAIARVSITVRDLVEVEGLDGVIGRITRPHTIDLTTGLGPTHGNLAMFLDRLLDAVGDEAVDAMMEVG